ncbi:MAG: peptidase S10 [Parachlamydiales bacterium]
MKRILILFVFIFGSRLFAEDLIEKDSIKLTRHSMIVNGKELNYTASAGSLIVKNKNTKSKAKIFFVSYTKDCDFSKDRPISFVFNGGPGSASVWLHMGALGPKRVLSWEENQSCVPPYQLEDNQETILDFTDIVFIDPVGTGFSDIIEGSDDDFFGLNEDAESVGDFIYGYINSFKRWVSPKYIIGESYGGMRAICVTEYLQDNYNIFLNGVSLISPVINCEHYIDSSISSHLSYALVLPTFAATAWHHHLLSEELQNKSLEDVISEAKDFALNDYIIALIQGDQIADFQREKIVLRLSELIGISKEKIEESNLRIDEFTFLTNLFPKDKSTDLVPVAGVHDTRVKGYARYLRENPSVDRISGAYSAIANDYIRNELEFTSEKPYTILNETANRDWKWNFFGSFKNVDLSNNIRHIFATNPNIKIFVGCGYFDLATPFFCNKYAIDHLHLPISYKEKITLQYYEAGHMPYLHRESHKKLKEDLFKFFSEKN